MYKKCNILPFSGVITPCRIRKSMTTGQLVVLNSGENRSEKHSEAGSNWKAWTSPSAFVGSKSTGNSRSNTNSVFGKIPRLLSNKNETHPADTIFLIKLLGIDASSAASLIAVKFEKHRFDQDGCWCSDFIISWPLPVSSIPYPTDKPPPTILSHFPGHVCFVSERCCSQIHKPCVGCRTYPFISTP